MEVFILDDKKYLENGFKNIKKSNPHKGLKAVRDIDVDALGKDKTKYGMNFFKKD